MNILIPYISVLSENVDCDVKLLDEATGKLNITRISGSIMPRTALYAETAVEFRNTRNHNKTNMLSTLSAFPPVACKEFQGLLSSFPVIDYDIEDQGKENPHQGPG